MVWHSQLAVQLFRFHERGGFFVCLVSRAENITVRSPKAIIPTFEIALERRQITEMAEERNRMSKFRPNVDSMIFVSSFAVSIAGSVLAEIVAVFVIVECTAMNDRGFRTFDSARIEPCLTMSTHAVTRTN
jgi:hypothetical protein